jgi:hypothetical protein
MRIKKLLEQKDIDGVFICTPWEWHTPMAVDAMHAGKAVACEVAGAMSIDECWQLVRTYEKHYDAIYDFGKCMLQERDVMAILKYGSAKILFGEMIHLEGGYQHDLTRR